MRPSLLRELACSSAFSLLTAGQHLLFQGTSVVILPDSDTASPRNSTFITSNFFSYAAPEGYLSYGWWLPAKLSSNTSYCQPDSQRFHWVEFGNGACDYAAEECVYDVVNFPHRTPHHVRPPAAPKGTVQYHVFPLHISDGPMGQMAVSYVDSENLKAFGVGTREILSDTPGQMDNCRKALNTMHRVVEEFGPSLGFELRDICGHETRAQISDEGQKVLEL